jgi:hypothetical protein
MNIVCCFFTHCQPLPNFCHHQIVVSVTICCPEWSDITYTWMLSPVYKNMVNLVVHLSIMRCQSKFINVTVWERHTFDNKIFGCGKIYYSDSVIITNSCKLSFPIVSLKCLPYLLCHWNLLTKFSYGIEGIYQIHVLVLHRICPSCHIFITHFSKTMNVEIYY